MDTPNPSPIERTERTIPLLILGAIGTLVFICAAAFFVYYNTDHLLNSRDWRDHSQEVLTTLQSTTQRLERVSYASRLYLAGKDEEDRAAAQSAAIILDTGLVHLDELVRDNASQAARSTDLHACVTSLKHMVDDALPHGVSLQAKVLSCLDGVSKMQESERTLLAQRTRESQQSIYRSMIAGASFLLVALIVVATLFAFLLRDARRRLVIDQQIYSTNVQLEANVLTLRKRASEASLLTSAREELQLCTDLSQAHEAVVRYSKQLLPSAHAALFAVNENHQTVEMSASSTDALKLLDGFSLDACCGLRSGRLRWRQPGKSEVHCSHFLGAPPENYICIPLAAHGDTLGILYIECPTPLVAIDVESNFDSLEELAEIAAMSIAGLNLRSRLEQQSIRDGLTNLFNRRFMEIALNREVRRARRSQSPLTLLMLDVDHFKMFNDTYGHEAGDLVLREVAETLRQSVRAEDIAFRYGGEEFFIIMPETSEETGQERAESIRDRVSQTHLSSQDLSLGNITVSIGVAVFPQCGNSPEDLVRAADRALYAAKRDGRNRVVVAEGSVVTSI